MDNVDPLGRRPDGFLSRLAYSKASHDEIVSLKCKMARKKEALFEMEHTYYLGDCCSEYLSAAV